MTRLVAPAPGDAAIVAGWSRSAEEARLWCSRAEHPFPTDVVRGWWKADDVQPWLLSEGERSVAYGELWIDAEEDEVELARLIVDPARRRTGLGRRLVDQLLLAARDTGLSECFLRVAPDNAPALALYRSAGFLDVDADRTETWNASQHMAYVWLEWRR